MHAKVDSVVEKLYTEVTSRPGGAGGPGGMGRSLATKKTVESAALLALEKRMKNQESSMRKEITDREVIVEQLKRELADRCNLLAELTESERAKEVELNQLRVLVAHLYEQLDNGSSTGSLHSAGGSLEAHGGSSAGVAFEQLSPSDVAISTSGAGGYTESPHRLFSTPALTSVFPFSTGTSNRGDALLTTGFESVVDFVTKGKGRSKLIWTPKYAVLRPFILAFYNSREEREQGVMPFEEIPICQVRPEVFLFLNFYLFGLVLFEH
ncbi:unnamed protein product [Protopolystoma xenopodis]|uniref:Uncharacterized protein n=1 Tax=Protopolystoma xenopodis TaxID=117903 RepID=A0A3S5AYA2_9PLAT|nr:unnamed protein product [Protopolystoma xenopodis]